MTAETAVPTDPGAPLEHLDVVIVGAGLSGIGAAHHVRTDAPWASMAIFESRGAIGGTWDLFRYPGIRSDSDMHTLGYPFRPWQGERSIADGESILQYIRDTAAEDGTDELIRFHHRIVAASWSTDDARWTLTVEVGDAEHGTVTTQQVTCGFLFSCTGYYRYDSGYLPDFEGMDDFTGTIVHPQFWPEDLDVSGKRVVVIGSGATAVTLVPSLAAQAEHVTMLQRSPTYIASLPGKNPAVDTIRRVVPERWSGDAVRWTMALGTQATYHLSRRRPDVVKRALRRGIERELPEGYDVATHFTPSYDPWDQRLCVVPDGDLFRAIRKGTASVVTDHIDRFTPDGILLRSGATVDADVIVTATGLELLFIGGIDVTVDGEHVDLPDRLTYKGMMIEGVPNLALAIGYTNASWTLKSDLTCDYVVRLLDHMRRTGQRQCTPRRVSGQVTAEPLLGLSSGYVQRSADRFPKQGSEQPWQIHQSYLKDYRALKRSQVTDESMQFSNPGEFSDAMPNHQATVASDAAPDRFEGRVAAITGAGSGIGRALAEALARRGCHVALSDVDETGLAETVTRCEGRGVKVTSQRVDVADRDAVYAWAATVADEHGSVNFIFNNAGVALAATVESMDDADFEWLMDINFWGVVHGTKAFLPYLEASGDGHVINISSVFGLVSIPSQSAYNAAKFGVRGFTDALRIELDIAGGPVSSTTIHPGGIKTNIARNARVDDEVRELTGSTEDAGDLFERIAMTSPAKAARQILTAVEKDKRRALIGPDAKVFDLVSRLPAGLYQRAIVRGSKLQR